jgi:hypothetical protein
MDNLEASRAWRRLMLNNDGTLNADADMVLRDLETVCGWMVSALPVDNNGRVDPLKTAAALERRGVFAHVKKRLFGPLDQLLKRETRT